MGFWDTVKKVGKFGLDQLKKADTRSKEYQNDMPRKSDRALAKIIVNERTSSPLKAGAAWKELQSRGYSAQDVTELAK